MDSFFRGTGIAVPPSLRTSSVIPAISVCRETHGNLLGWARQGVLLLNTVLTVQAGLPASHQGKGWEAFTDACISALSSERQGLVFLLWGSSAQAKGRLIDSARHLVLKAPHPSPLSAHRGFLGCGHFSKANAYLQASGRAAIDWGLPTPAETATS